MKPATLTKFVLPNIITIGIYNIVTMCAAVNIFFGSRIYFFFVIQFIT